MKYSSCLVVPALLAGVLFGVTSQARAYTINTTEVGKRIRWANDTVSLQMDPEFQNFLDPGDAYASLEIGFEAWRGLARVPNLVINSGTPDSLGNHEGHPTNGIYLLRDWPYEAAKLAVTIVTYEMDTGRLLDADIVVNGQAKFALLKEPLQAGLDSYDLAAVLTHESGHVLGLGESAEGVDATMWPYARPDDTDKRTLAPDDEDGVTESYLSAPPAAAGGCGGNSVGGRVSTRGGIAASLWLLAVIPMLRITRRRRRQVAALSLIAMLAMLVGFDTQSTQAALAEQRLVDVETLLSKGTRDDRARIEALSSDSDPQLASRARFALGRVLARAGSARVSAADSDAKLRIQHLMGTGTRLWVGHVHHTGTVEQNGLLFTEYQVQTPAGDSTTLRVPGGSKDNVGQRVMDAEPPPSDAQEVAVVPQSDGTQHWSYHQNGLLFGGHLGDGAAINGAL
jgi:Matrixin